MLFLSCVFQLLSIGISDGIEFYFNKPVHYYHNCPDIIRIPFERYNYHHAFMSGIICSWFLILAQYIIFRCLNVTDVEPIVIVSIVNMLLPIFVNPNTCNDIFMSHKLLYLINIGLFFLEIGMKYYAP